MTKTGNTERGLVAIFAATVEGYGRLTGTDEAGPLKGLTERRAILDKLFLEHWGRIANTAGNSLGPASCDCSQRTRWLHDFRRPADCGPKYCRWWPTMKNVTGEAWLKPKIVGSQIARMRGWLSKTPPTFQEEVLKRCRSLTFQPGETLYHLGEEHGGIYGLIEGGVAISAAPTDRGPYLVHFGRPGFWVGAAPLFMSRRLVGVTVTRPSVCLHLPQNEIQAMVVEIPSAWRLFGMLAMFNCDLTLSALDDLMIREPVKRCAAVLLRLGDCRDPNLTETSPIELDVRQEDIATMANLSRSATSNFLRSLADRNVISLEYRVIRILDAEALRNEANTA